MKIMFIVPRSLNPKQTYGEYPMGAGYICTYLKKLGFSIKIIDQAAEKISDAAIPDVIMNYGADIVAYSILTPSYPCAKLQIGLIRSRLFNIPVIAGGVHSTIFPKLLLDDGFDAVVIGEGEYEVQHLCLTYEKYKMFPKSNNIVISSMSRLTAMDNVDDELEKKIIKDELILDRSVYNLDLYDHHSILAARGCPFSCKFCCNYKKIFGTYYIRSIKSVISELIELEKQYGADTVFFADDIFLMNQQNIIDFCKEYKRVGLQVKWIAQLRVDLINEKTATTMKENGCLKICFGVESGSQTILDAANKRIDIHQAEKAIRETKNVGLRVKTWWIVGLPGSYSEQLKSLDLMLAARPNEISVHQLIPFPGTDYYNYSDRYGIMIRDKYNFSSFCYGGIGDNFSFDYLTKGDYRAILNAISRRLEDVGYVSSDCAKKSDEYIYTLPISHKSIRVFGEEK